MPCWASPAGVLPGLGGGGAGCMKLHFLLDCCRLRVFSALADSAASFLAAAAAAAASAFAALVDAFASRCPTLSCQSTHVSLLPQFSALQKCVSLCGLQHHKIQSSRCSWNSSLHHA